MVRVYENRWYLLSRNRKLWRRIRGHACILNYIISATFFIPFLFFVPDQTEAVPVVLKVSDTFWFTRFLWPEFDYVAGFFHMSEASVVNKLTKVWIAGQYIFLKFTWILILLKSLYWSRGGLDQGLRKYFPKSFWKIFFQNCLTEKTGKFEE